MRPGQREKFFKTFADYCKYVGDRRKKVVECGHPKHTKGCQYKSCPFVVEFEKFLKLSRLENFLM